MYYYKSWKITDNQIAFLYISRYSSVEKTVGRKGWHKHITAAQLWLWLAFVAVKFGQVKYTKILRNYTGSSQLFLKQQSLHFFDPTPCPSPTFNTHQESLLRIPTYKRKKQKLLWVKGKGMGIEVPGSVPAGLSLPL